MHRIKSLDLQEKKRSNCQILKDLSIWSEIFVVSLSVPQFQRLEIILLRLLVQSNRIVIRTFDNEIVLGSNMLHVENKVLRLFLIGH